ncbi:MAG: GNAT family N-acetyltransferase [Aggregatilineales bacterium]
MSELMPDYSRYFWQGEKIRLRSWRLDDANVRFMTLLDSQAVAQYQDGIELPTSINQQAAWLEKVVSGENNSMVRFAMENADGNTVGWVTLHSRDQKNGTFGFGVAVYCEYRGNGYAVDAVGIILKYGFREQRYQKCNSMCLHTNAASIRMHEKLGFIKEGQIRRTCFYDGQYHDDVLFGMTREEFDDLTEA